MGKGKRDRRAAMRKIAKRSGDAAANKAREKSRERRELRRDTR